MTHPFIPSCKCIQVLPVLTQHKILKNSNLKNHRSWLIFGVIHPYCRIYWHTEQVWIEVLASGMWLSTLEAYPWDGTNMNFRSSVRGIQNQGRRRIENQCLGMMMIKKIKRIYWVNLKNKQTYASCYKL
jgi:hypothetical protein